MPDQRNEGEGNRTADKDYVARTKKFVDSGKVQPAADKAKEAVEGDEAGELSRAEEAGKRRGRGER